MKRRFASAVLTFALVAAGTRHADADDGEAERLFREGRKLMLEGRFEEACAAIAESQRLDPHVGTLLNLATCHEKQGKVATAWVEYQKALTAARAEGQADRIKLAEQRSAVLEPRVPWVRVTTPTRPEGLVVTLDGSELAPVALGSEMPVDPGRHVVAASAAKRAPFEETFELHEGQHRSLLVDLLEQLPKSEDTPPERVVVEPSKPTPQVKAQERARWIAEAGLFVGLLWGQVDSPQPYGDVAMRPTSGNGDWESCSSCRFESGSSRAAVAGGVNAFVGYAFSENVSGGLRLLLGQAFNDKAFTIAAGPGVELRASNAMNVGLFLLVGDGSFNVRTTANPPAGYSVDYETVTGHGSISGGFGAGVNVALRIAELGRGALVANTTPLILAGTTGTAFALPVTLAYRFQ